MKRKVIERAAKLWAARVLIDSAEMQQGTEYEMRVFHETIQKLADKLSGDYPIVYGTIQDAIKAIQSPS